MSYENSILPILAVALVGGAGLIYCGKDKKCNHKSNKKCDKKCKKNNKKCKKESDNCSISDPSTGSCDGKCIDAKNFKSQLGETVAANSTWKIVNTYFNTNEVTIKANAAKVNQATDQASYAIGANALTALATASGNRILVTQPDGTVYFDSSKGIANSYANAIAKTINENHNTRASIMSAQLTCDGRGNELKLSTSTNQIEAYDARVIVQEYGNNLGTVRVSRASQSS